MEVDRSSGYPLTVTVTLFLLSTSILTWCFSILPNSRDPKVEGAVESSANTQLFELTGLKIGEH